MVDKKLLSHEIALETAKKYVEANLPEYRVAGTEKIALDMVKEYKKAYRIASMELSKPD